MKVVDPGHDYLLERLDGAGHERLRFVKRVGIGYPGNEEPAHSGTTTQEVLRALIERSEYVNDQIPCAETQSVTELLRAAILLLEVRAARRHGRFLSLPDLTDLDSPTCEECGHVGCAGACRP